MSAKTRKAETPAQPSAIDETEFASLLEHHRREIHVHCYRMLASFDEAEDLVQESFLRAWGHHASFDGTRFRAWLYRIATNACLDAIRRSRAKRRLVKGGLDEIPWIQPYPDVLLDEIAPREEGPEAVAIMRETIELAFIAAVQLLPPRQRAVFILREVLQYSTSETASVLDMAIAAVNSALQRARSTLRGKYPAKLEDPIARPDEQERALITRFMEMHEHGDFARFAELLRDDVRVTMPPNTDAYVGPASLAPLIESARSMGAWRLVRTHANRQPATVSYLREPGSTEYRLHKVDVFRIEGNAIAEITTFDGRELPAFQFPPVYEHRKRETEDAP